MIAIINTGGANLASVSNALDRLGQTWVMTEDAATIRDAERVILPGVGAARDSMNRLRQAGLLDIIRGLSQPVLGICVGMQLLFERSAEGDTECLGIIPGTVRGLVPSPGLRVPHMGWNRVTPVADEHPLWSKLDQPDHFYFVHSYTAPLGEWVCATVVHGETIPAIVHRGNFYGCQFHPERSAEAGARFLNRFLSL
ncbi:MAG: imidazole glycerol phosphate synthase subunit HisH [Myxococcota bacterium]